MNRREMMMAIGGATIAATAGTGFAANAGHNHNHGAHASKRKHEELIKIAAKCLRSGEIANLGSLDAAEKGDTSLIKSFKLIQETIVACEALIRLATYDSANLPAIASATAAICEAARKECLNHKGHPAHAECARLCGECAAACKKVV